MKRARDIKEQLVELCKRVEIDYADEKLSVIDDEYYTNVGKLSPQVSSIIQPNLPNLVLTER